jgi:MFS family permease
MMAGMLVSSIGAGRIISRTGRYRIFPILGTALAALSMLSLALTPTSAPTGFLVMSAIGLGLGMGLVMQIVVLAIQNAVPRYQLGAATASASLSRSVGSSLGVSVFGTLMNARLGMGSAEGRMNLNALVRLPPAARAQAVNAFAAALHLVFLAGAAVLAVAFVLALLLKETPIETRKPVKD